MSLNPIILTFSYDYVILPFMTEGSIVPAREKGVVPERAGTSSVVIIFHEAISRGLTGRIIARFEDAGIGLVGGRMLTLDRDQAEAYHAELAGRPYFNELVEQMIAGPVMALALQAPDAVKRVRKVVGSIDPMKAENGSINGDFKTHLSRPIAEASDTDINVVRHLDLFFPQEL